MSDSWRTGRPTGGYGGRGGGMGGRGRGGRGGMHDTQWQSGRGGGGWANRADKTQVIFDGKVMRKKQVKRPTVDVYASIGKFIEQQVAVRDHRDIRWVQPDETYYPDLLPISNRLDEPAQCITTRLFKSGMNKQRCPVFVVRWTPEGRRLLTGNSNGEMTLWNGLMANFETITQAHETAVRCMKWSNDHAWMATGDDGGYIKYWQSNMNNVTMFLAHKDKVREVCFAPTDKKIATCSDDGSVRIFDFATKTEERELRGHGADVKSVDWHPQKGLLASGSRDPQQPVMLWDPRQPSPISTLHIHKNTVTTVKWNMNGNWLLTGGQDHLVKIFDVRSMKELHLFRGHSNTVTSLAWHPIHENLFASGGHDGSIIFWLAGNDTHVGAMEKAHNDNGAVWSLDWHPLGHMLTSGSNDHSTKFWTRNRPGDDMQDRYNLLADQGDPRHAAAGSATQNPYGGPPQPPRPQVSSQSVRVPGLAMGGGSGGGGGGGGHSIPGLAPAAQMGGLQQQSAVPGLRGSGSSVPGLGAWHRPDAGQLPHRGNDVQRNTPYAAPTRPPARPPQGPPAGAYGGGAPPQRPPTGQFPGQLQQRQQYPPQGPLGAAPSGFGRGAPPQQYRQQPGQGPPPGYGRGPPGPPPSGGGQMQMGPPQPPPGGGVKREPAYPPRPPPQGR